MSIESSSTLSQEHYQLDLLGMVNRKFWAVFFFILLGLGLSTLYFFKMPKTFSSESKLVVEERQQAPSFNVAEGEALTTQNPVEKYIEIITSNSVLRPAIINGKFDELESFAGDVDQTDEDILAAIKENFVAKAKDTKTKSPGVIHLTYSSPSEIDCQTILKQIVLEFDNYLQTISTNVGDNVTKTSTKRRDELEEQLKQTETQLALLSANPNLQFRDGKVVNQHQEQQLKLQAELDEIRRERTRLEARMKKLEQAKQSGSVTDEMALDALSELNEGSLGAYVITHQEFIKLKIEEQKLIAEYGSEHPEVMGIRNQIEMVDELRRKELAAIRGGTENSTSLADVVTGHMKNHIEIQIAEEQSLIAEMQQEQQKAALINQDVVKMDALQNERNRLSGIFAVELDRLKEYEALKEFNWRELSVLNPPSPGEQTAPDLLISLAVGLLLGGIAGLAYAAVKEFAEKTFHSSEQIAQVLGTPVLAHIHNFNTRISKDSKQKKLAGDLVAVHRPETPPAEQYRSLRTSVFFKAQKTNAKTIQITSPTPGDGKSTLASNLAVVIAQAGRSVLLVDCDLRRPTQHQRFGVENKLGVTSIVAGVATPEEVIVPTGIDHFSLMPSGPIFSNPSELLSSQAFPDLLKYLAERYDFVIIDTPPVLPVTDPCIVSNYVDAIYLTIRIRNGVQVNAQHAIEALETVGSNVSGIVVNGIQRSDAKSYRYGESYGRGSYRAGYQTYYSSRENKSKAPIERKSKRRDPAET